MLASVRIAIDFLVNRRINHQIPHYKSKQKTRLSKTLYKWFDYTVDAMKN